MRVPIESGDAAYQNRSAGVEQLGDGIGIPWYRRYHCPIDSPEDLGSNRIMAGDSVGRAHCKRQLARTVRGQEENDEYDR